MFRWIDDDGTKRCHSLTQRKKKCKRKPSNKSHHDKRCCYQHQVNCGVGMEEKSISLVSDPNKGINISSGKGLPSSQSNPRLKIYEEKVEKQMTQNSLGIKLILPYIYKTNMNIYEKRFLILDEDLNSKLIGYHKAGDNKCYRVYVNSYYNIFPYLILNNNNKVLLNNHTKYKNGLSFVPQLKNKKIYVLNHLIYKNKKDCDLERSLDMNIMNYSLYSDRLWNKFGWNRLIKQQLESLDSKGVPESYKPSASKYSLYKQKSQDFVSGKSVVQDKVPPKIKIEDMNRETLIYELYYCRNKLKKLKSQKI